MKVRNLLQNALMLGALVSMPLNAFAASPMVPTIRATVDIAGTTSASGAKQPPLTKERLEGMYWDAWFKLGETYYDPSRLTHWLDWEHKFDGKLRTEIDLDAALSAMTESLGDPWTTYQSSHERLLDVFASVRGLINLGMVLRPNESGDYYVKIVPYGTLARNAGIQAGDVVQSIGGKTLKGLNQKQVDDLLSVTAGKDVSVSYSSVDGSRTVAVKTTQSEVQYAEAKMMPGKMLYARLSSYLDGSYVGQFNAAVSKALENEDADGMILDLRGNPGGVFELVQNETSFFIPGQPLVRVHTRNHNLVTDSVITAQPLLSFEMAGLPQSQQRMIKLFSTKPIIVLVDGSTASAAEVMTGALKDNKRATVIGVRTFAKGVGFDEEDLPLGGQMTITSMKYLTPSGVDVSVDGIGPQIIVQQPHDGTDRQLDAGFAELRRQITASKGH